MTENDLESLPPPLRAQVATAYAKLVRTYPEIAEWPFLLRPPLRETPHEPER